MPHNSLLVFFFRNLGWDPKKGESHLNSLLRPVLLVALVKLGHDKTINEGVRRFSIFAHDRNTSLLPPDTRKVLPFFLTLYDALAFYLPHIYCDVLQAAYFAAMQNVTTSHRSAYNDLLKVYKESDEAEERGRVLSMWLFNNP